MGNDLLSKRQNTNLLFDFYGTLLTEKQRSILIMYVVEDCSFTEIGKDQGITPQAVADFVKRATKQLEKYEESLGMVAKLHIQNQIIEEIRSHLHNLNSFGWADVCDIVEKLNGLVIKLTV